MPNEPFPTIDMKAAGWNIVRLHTARGLSVRDVQNYFGFEQPQAVYKWQSGRSLPSVDNLYALSVLLGVHMDEILVPSSAVIHIGSEQQDSSCCSGSFMGLLYIASASLSFNLQLKKRPALPEGFLSPLPASLQSLN